MDQYMDSVYDHIEEHVAALEEHLGHLKDSYGDRLPFMQTPDGTYIVQPVLCSLVNGYVALTKLPRRKRKR